MNDFRPPYEAWFGDEAVTIAPCGGAGLSGSGVFLVQTPSGRRFVLKSFAHHVVPGRAAWIHALMTHLARAGLGTVPHVLPRRSGAAGSPRPDCETLVADDVGGLWELTDFLPGTPRQTPSPDEAAAALAALARLHEAAATLPGSTPRIEPSIGVHRRASQAAQITSAPWRLLESDVRRWAPPAVAPSFLLAIETFESHGGIEAVNRIAAVDPVPVAVQAVLRDIWSDHVLFLEDGSHAGFIDFHAADRDTPATDLARLLGSWHATPGTAGATWLQGWRHAIEAYETVRPLTTRELALVPWLHATGVICGLDNWFRWLVMERRVFADISSVQSRISRLVAQLPDAFDMARHLVPGRD